MKPLDDKRFQIRLKKRFRQMLYALGAQQCFMMPERVAKTPATTQIKEYIGSGPFVFLAKEWVSGATSAYKKFDKYVPRQEQPEYLSGGKVVNFERVEWVVEPDPATSAAALQTGEVDFVEFPLIDLLPTLRKARGCAVGSFDPLGVLAIIAFNHLYPPFDNPRCARRCCPRSTSSEFVTSWSASRPISASTRPGFFTAGAPMANTVGLDAFTEPARSGQGEEAAAGGGLQGREGGADVAVGPAVAEAMAQVTREHLREGRDQRRLSRHGLGHAGLAPRQQDPPDKGGWNVFCTTWGGLAVSNPGSSYPLRCNGKKGWFGWPTDAKIEAAAQQWFDTRRSRRPEEDLRADPGPRRSR